MKTENLFEDYMMCSEDVESWRSCTVSEDVESWKSCTVIADGVELSKLNYMFQIDPFCRKKQLNKWMEKKDIGET